MKKLIIGAMVLMAILTGCAEKQQLNRADEFINAVYAMHANGEITDEQAGHTILATDYISAMYEMDNDGKYDEARQLAKWVTSMGWYFDRNTQEFFLQD